MRTFLLKIIGPLGIFCLAALILVLAVKGKPGDAPDKPWYYQFDYNTSVEGPFESSNSASRYALTEAIVFHQRVNLDDRQARFAAPDLVYYNGIFQTIFTPGISFFAVPFFWLGSFWAIPQIGAFSSTLVLALLNLGLVYKIARKLQVSAEAAWLSAFTFLFATNAFVYALTLTQHHGSIAVILSAILLTFYKVSWKSMVGFGVLCGIGLLFDFPNLLLLLPLGIFLFFKGIHVITQEEKIKVSIAPQLVGILIGVLPLLAMYGWYNQQVAGSPLKMGQFIGRTNYFDTAEKKASDAKATEQDAKDPYRPKLPFQTRLQIQGAEVLLLSNERAWWFYSPVLLIGILGFFAAIRNPETKTVGVLMLSMVLVNFVIYISFGDPWGGWSFGPRYLLPAAAIMSIMVGVALTRYRSILSSALFGILVSYSVIISTLGALTSAAIAPKQEAVVAIFPTKFTYQHSFDLLEKGQLSSLVYNAWLKYFIIPVDYYLLLTGFILFVFCILIAKYHRRAIK